MMSRANLRPAIHAEWSRGGRVTRVTKLVCRKLTCVIPHIRESNSVQVLSGMIDQSPVYGISHVCIHSLLIDQGLDFGRLVSISSQTTFTFTVLLCSLQCCVMKPQSGSMNPTKYSTMNLNPPGGCSPRSRILVSYYHRMNVL